MAAQKRVSCNRQIRFSVLTVRRARSWPCFHWRGREHALPAS